MARFNPQEVQRLLDTYADTILRLSCTYLNSTQDAEDICQVSLTLVGVETVVIPVNPH